MLIKRSDAFNKGEPRFRDSGVVLKRPGSLVTAVDTHGKLVTRNVSFFTPSAQGTSTAKEDETIQEENGPIKQEDGAMYADVRARIKRMQAAMTIM